MSADRLYKDGDIVWVKLGSNWWPAEVVDDYRQPADLLRQIKYEPYCVVKFFEEDQYEIVRRSRQIYPFKCDKKEEFIRKGLDLLHVNHHDFMKKFPADVEIAERLTRRVVESDLHVINDRPFSILKAIIGQKLTTVRSDYYNNDIRPSTSHIRRSGDSVTKILNIIPTRKNESAATENSSTYRCNFCEFTSLRQNVMILHNKTHSNGGIYGGAARKPKTSSNDSTSPATERNKTQKTEARAKSAVVIDLDDVDDVDDDDDDGDDDDVGDVDVDDDDDDEVVLTTANKTNSSIESGKVKMPVPMFASTTRRSPNATSHLKLKRTMIAEEMSTAERVASPIDHDEVVVISESLSDTLSTRRSDEINHIDVSQITCQNDDDDDDTYRNKLDTRRNKILESKPDPQDFVKNLEADWSDGEEVTAVDNADRQTISIITEDKTSPELMEIGTSDKGNESNATTVEIETSTHLFLPSSSNRIRNIPKKDRRDIILKEFHLKDNNCYSQSSATVTSSPVGPTESGSNSNSCESDVIMGKGKEMGVVRKAIDEHLDEPCQIAEAGVRMKVPTAKELHLSPTATDIVETNTLETNETSTCVDDVEVATTQQTSSAVAQRSCFDFEEDEDNESDVLTSIANFKRKHFSPDKTANNLNDETTTKPGKKTVEADTMEHKDNQLSDEIESLLSQTKSTVADISKLASSARDDVSVKALPIKERGKRIFKSRNRSQVEDQPKTLLGQTPIQETAFVVLEEHSIKETAVVDSRTTIQQIDQQEYEILQEQKQDEENSYRNHGQTSLPKRMDNSKLDDSLPERKNDIGVYSNTNEEDCNIAKELAESVENTEKCGYHQDQEEDQFVIQVLNIETETERDIHMEGNKIEDCADDMPHDDEVIPIIRHAPVEIYKDDHNSKVLEPLADNDVTSLSEEREIQRKDKSKSKERASNVMLPFLHTGRYDAIQDSKDNTEESIELNICSTNNDIEAEAVVSRFTSPTDENSSVGISEAGAEFGSPTSMLDDERLPIVAGNLIANVETMAENVGEVIIESDVIIEEQVEEYESSADGVNANIDSTCQEELPVVQVSNYTVASHDDCNKTNSSIAVELAAEEANENGVNENTADVNGISSDAVAEEEEEDIEFREEDDEDDEIESPPHEKLSGDEMDKNEDIGRNRSFSKTIDKTKTNADIPKGIAVDGSQELQKSELPAGNKFRKIDKYFPEVRNIEEKNGENCDELETIYKPSRQNKDYTETEGNRCNKSDGELFPECTDEEVIVSFTESVVDVVHDTKNETAIDTKAIVLLESTPLPPPPPPPHDSAISKVNCGNISMENSSSTTEKQSLGQLSESKAQISSPVGNSKETFSRKRRSHIKITPRKRVADVTLVQSEHENMCKMKPKSRKKSEEFSPKKAEDGDAVEIQPHVKIIASNLHLNEAANIDLHENSPAVETKVGSPFEPLENIGVDVGASELQQRTGQQMCPENKVSVSNLPTATTTTTPPPTLSKSSQSALKRKKSIENDINSITADQDGEEESSKLGQHKEANGENGNDVVGRGYSLQSSPQMFILNPPPSKQQKLTEDDSNGENPSSTIFDIGNIPILITNEKLATESMEIVISPSAATDVEAQLEAMEENDEDTAISNTEQEEEQMLLNKSPSRKTSTPARSKRTPSRQQSQHQQATEGENASAINQKLERHHKQQQNTEQKVQTNKQLGIDSRGNKYVIIKTPPSDVVIQQQPQHEEQLTSASLQQHSVVGNQTEASIIFEADDTSAFIVDDSVESGVEAGQNIIASVSQQLKQKSPAAAATGGRKQAGNIITLPESIACKQQQQFNEAIQSVCEAESSSSPRRADYSSPKRAPNQQQQPQQKSSKWDVVESNTKNRNRSSSSGNRRPKTQQQCLEKQEEAAYYKQLPTKTTTTTTDEKSFAGTVRNRRLSSTEEASPPKVTKKTGSKSFAGDVVIAQQQQQQQHKLQSKKHKKHQEKNSIAAKNTTSPKQKNTAESHALIEFNSQESSSAEQESVHSTIINEEQLMQPQPEDQIDGPSKILAVPTQPIPGYNETFLLCTLVDNNYKPIDNIPLYLDHDLNQLVPVPLEAMDGQPNLIVNHPPAEEVVDEVPASALVQQANDDTTANVTFADALKDVNVDSTTQLIYLQPQLLGSETPMTGEEIAHDDAAIAEDAAGNVGNETQMTVYLPPPTCSSDLQPDSSLILNIEGQEIMLDAATLSHLLANPDANTQLITDDGTEFVLTREVLAALEAQQDAQEESAAEQQQQGQQIGEAGPTDILAVALAGTDLYGSEVLEIETSQGLQLVGADDIVYHQQTTLPHAHLTPPITALTSETNALLNQTPIMSTLEKPSTSGKLKTTESSSAADLFAAAVSLSELPNCRPNLDDSLAVIGVTASSSVPTSLELPITVTNPAIAPKSTMAGPTAAIGLPHHTTSVVVTEEVQFHCLPHRTGLTPGETRIYNDPSS